MEILSLTEGTEFTEPFSTRLEVTKGLRPTENTEHLHYYWL